MTRYAVQHATVAAVFDSPEFDALAAEYANEAMRNPAFADTTPDRELYDKLEQAGMLSVLVVMLSDGASATISRAL